jgi:hypothetical protein
VANRDLGDRGGHDFGRDINDRGGGHYDIEPERFGHMMGNGRSREFHVQGEPAAEKSLR